MKLAELTNEVARRAGTAPKGSTIPRGRDKYKVPEPRPEAERRAAFRGLTHAFDFARSMMRDAGKP